MLDFLKRKREPAPNTKAGKPHHRAGMRGAVRYLLDAARADRLSADLPTVPVPADDFIAKNQKPFVARSRHLALSNDYARGFLRMCRQNIVGSQGVVLQAMARDTNGTLDEAANDAIEADFRQWSKRENCDVTGKRSLRQILSRAVEDAATNGEFMIRFVVGRDVNDWGIALQVLDPQRCPVDFNQDKLPGGRFIRHGIEYDEWGKPTRYLFSTLKASEAEYTYGGRHFISLPAGEVMHGYLEDLVGQRRGLPWMMTALLRMHNLDGFEKAALVNARVSAAKGGFFEWEEGMGPADVEDSDEPLYMDAEPGSYQELPPGLKFKGWDPQYPNGELAPFSKEMKRGFSTGLGVAYNTLANDLEGVNFSSIRQGVLTEREHWKDLQEWLIESLLEPLFDVWLPRALLKGIRIPGKLRATLRPEQLEKYRAHAWQPRRWDWVDPDKDSKTAERDIRNKIKSPSEVIRARGGDPRSVWRQWAADRQAMLDAGIPESIVDASLGSPVAPTTEETARDEGQE